MATTMKIANRATRNSTRIDDSVFLNVYENGAGTSTTHGQESLLQQRKQFFDEIFRSLGVYEWLRATSHAKANTGPHFSR